MAALSCFEGDWDPINILYTVFSGVYGVDYYGALHPKDTAQPEIDIQDMPIGQPPHLWPYPYPATTPSFESGLHPLFTHLPDLVRRQSLN